MSLARYLSKLGALLNSDGKVPQAALAANVAGNGPAFSAQQVAPQSIANNTFTKLAFVTEVFDTSSAYDAPTSRFQPLVAGYYQINVTAAIDSGSSGAIQAVAILKNGSINVATSWGASATSQYVGAQVSQLVYLNGSTDYIECQIFHNVGAARSTLAGANSGFSGALIRAA